MSLQEGPTAGATPIYEDADLPPPATPAADSRYAHEPVELRPVTDQEPAAQYEEIELSANAAYGRVRR